jgi:hypothetical protein
MEITGWCLLRTKYLFSGNGKAMTSQDKDRYIVEWFGECWHEMFHYCNPKTGMVHCKKCYKEMFIQFFFNPNLDLTTWEGFGWLWGKMRTWDERRLWDNFISWWNEDTRPPDSYVHVALLKLIDHPEKFRDAVYEFLKSQEV